MERIKYLHETNRNVIITGIPRSGKSTVAHRLCQKLGYNIVQLDSIVEAMKRAFPEFKLKRKVDGILELSEFTGFLIEYLKELNDDPPRKKGINYVIEGSDIDLDEYFRHFKPDEFVIVGLVYSLRTPEDIYNNMKSYDNILDWSYYLTDDELVKYAEALFLRNKEYEKLFKKYKIKYYDISFHRVQIFEQIENDVVRLIQEKDNTM